MCSRHPRDMSATKQSMRGAYLCGHPGKRTAGSSLSCWCDTESIIHTSSEYLSMEPLKDVIAYYDGFAEESRLRSGPARLELERTKEILAKVLPQPPARVIDVGGAGGTYSAWLAERGYEAHLVDVSPRLVEQARQLNEKLEQRIASLSVAD